MGFTTHPSHEFGTQRKFFGLGGIKYFDAPTNTCPNCDKMGQYDGNKIRMVLCQDAMPTIYHPGYGAYAYPSYSHGYGYAGGQVLRVRSGYCNGT